MIKSLDQTSWILKEALKTNVFQMIFKTNFQNDILRCIQSQTTKMELFVIIVNG